MVSVATIFGEEIQRNFRNHLPPEAVKILIVMADQMMQMEKAINSQQTILEKVMKYSVLAENQRKMLIKELAKHDKNFDNSPITEAVENPEAD